MFALVPIRIFSHRQAKTDSKLLEFKRSIFSHFYRQQPTPIASLNNKLQLQLLTLVTLFPYKLYIYSLFSYWEQQFKI